MTTPWVPSPNPGGRNRELVATALGEWFLAQHIPGLNDVQYAPSGPDRVDWEAAAIGTTGPRCVVIVTIPSVREDRVASTGPSNFGGKLAHYDIETEIHYLSAEPNDWQAATFDCWRILDGLKDCLRGNGRDLGRGDVILQVGESPREQSITDQMDDPISTNGGIYVTGTLSFVVSQYMQQQPA